MRKASPDDEDIRQINQEPPADQGLPSEQGDIFAVGTPCGGTEVGGLAGTNVGDGAPDNADLEDAMGSGNFDTETEDEREGGPYGGPSGGAVGGTPAGKRARGGPTHHGIAPGGGHRGDSTVGEVSQDEQTGS
jgi:hypothetical protein